MQSLYAGHRPLPRRHAYTRGRWSVRTSIVRVVSVHAARTARRKARGSATTEEDTLWWTRSSVVHGRPKRRSAPSVRRSTSAPQPNAEASVQMRSSGPLRGGGTRGTVERLRAAASQEWRCCRAVGGSGGAVPASGAGRREGRQGERRGAWVVASLGSFKTNNLTLLSLATRRRGGEDEINQRTNRQTRKLLSASGVKQAERTST